MKLTKRDFRIELMNKLYQYDLYQSDNILYIPDFEFEEISETYFDVIQKLENIDHTIEKNLFNYSLYRLSFLDRAIIRLAVYEMLNTDTPSQVIIDEAIEITKIYSNLDDEKQHKFTNKVLDNINKAIKG